LRRNLVLQTLFSKRCYLRSRIDGSEYLRSNFKCFSYDFLQIRQNFSQWIATNESSLLLVRAHKGSWLAAAASSPVRTRTRMKDKTKYSTGTATRGSLGPTWKNVTHGQQIVLSSCLPIVDPSLPFLLF
jgi:hypothetical protein